MDSIGRLARRSGVALGVLALVATGCGSSSKTGTTATTSSPSSTSAGNTGSSTSSTAGTATNTASAPGITATTIKIGFVVDLTGAAASNESTAPEGVEAYFDAVNKAGGVDGRQLQLVTEDATSTTAGALSAVQVLISKGVFGVIAGTESFYAAYRPLQQAGIPVTGNANDGPEWGVQPDTNMFSTTGGIDANHVELLAAVPAASVISYLGFKNVGGLGYAISPASVSSIKDLKTALASDGISMGYEDLSLPVGSPDLSTPALAMKSAGVQIAVCACEASTVLGLVTDLSQAGSSAKSLSYSAADSSLFTDPTAAQAAQGSFYQTLSPPLDINNPASNTFENNLEAVDPSYKMGTYPEAGVFFGYEAAALMVKGLQVAGQNPTRKSFITNLTQVTNWTANGLLAGPVSFNHFGTAEPTYCNYYVQVKGQTFVDVDNGKDFCGTVPAGL